MAPRVEVRISSPVNVWNLKMKWFYCVAWFVVLLGSVINVNSVAVMSIDLGTEWMKIAVVSPGVPMEIVLNKESKRKTPVSISFRDGERSIGDDALSVGVRFPKNNYNYLLDLVGKTIDNPIVQLYQKRFPYYELVADPDRNTVVFKHDNDTFFAPEELLAMILSKAREYAEEFTDQTIKDVVITIPAFFNQAERRGILQAAELAGLKVLQLLNDNTAVALNYGMFRRKDFNTTAQIMLFYDMGAHSTTATVVSYELVKTKEKGYSETNPQLTVLGIGYDRTLGGLEMQLRLRDYLARSFNEMKKTPTDVFKNPRAMAKLFKEAGRLKNVLSANNDHMAQVEGVLEDHDFRLHVTREQFEEMCVDLYERVSNPVKAALKMADITMDKIDQVLLMGGCVRVPKVQENIQKAVGVELGKSLNMDEAAAMGAVYKAADLGQGFKVKKFATKDAVIFPIQVDFEREINNADGTKTVRLVKRTLFRLGESFPVKKVITFKQHADDFRFYVNYADLDYLPAEEQAAIGMTNLTKVFLSGVRHALEKHQDDEAKGVKAHFVLNENGVLRLTNVESVFEAMKEEEEETTFSRLSSTIGRLFSGGEDGGVETNENENKQIPEEEQEANKEEKDDKEKEGKDESKEEKKEERPKDENKTSNATAATMNETVTGRKKAVVEKEVISHHEEHIDVSPLLESQFTSSQRKIDSLNEFDRQKTLRDKSRNVLESFVLEIQEKLFNTDYKPLTTEDEREKLQKACFEVSDWLYEDGADSERDAYEKKLTELKTMFKPIKERVQEHQERPELLASMAAMLNMSQVFHDRAKGMDYFTEVELNVLQKLIEDTAKWAEEKTVEQSKLHFTATSKLTGRMIAEKVELLDREVKYLVNKARVKKVKADAEKAMENEKSEKTEEKKENESKEELKPEEPTTGESESLFDKVKKQKIDETPDEEKHSEL